MRKNDGWRKSLKKLPPSERSESEFSLSARIGHTHESVIEVAPEQERKKAFKAKFAFMLEQNSASNRKRAQIAHALSFGEH